MSYTLNEYQLVAKQTSMYPATSKIVYPALGLCGEAGEVAEKIKKILRDKNGLFVKEDKADIAKELGDVLWYVATLANDLGYTLEEVATINTHKLLSRKERGVLGGSGDNR
jgi:NTP pyrophosphatase (non-canonical NTP hydrolase)